MTTEKLSGCKPATALRHREDLQTFLLNAIQAPVNTQLFFLGRQQLYASVHQLHQMNQGSGHRATNLHAILYSRYCTEHFLSRHSLTSHNAAMEAAFANLLLPKDMRKVNERVDLLASPGDLEAGYLAIVQRFDPLTAHTSLALGARRITVERMDDFVAGAEDTSAYLEHKLRQDIWQLMSWSQRVAQWMRDHHFICGWVASAGILAGSPFLVRATLKVAGTA